MRVLIASHSAGLRGGAERCVLELAEALQADGRVEPIVATPVRGELTAALQRAGITTRQVVTPTWLVDASPPWPQDPWRAGRRATRAWRAAKGVGPWLALLREITPDVVMTSTTASPAAALASRRANVPHVWWVHEFTTRDHGRRYVLGEPIGQRSIGWLSDVVAVNSRAVADHYSPPVPREKVRIVELGVEPPPVDRNDVVAGELRCLMLGRKTPEKGCELALRALAELRDEPFAVSLRMVGPSVPGYSEALWHVAEDLGVLDHVQFREYVSDPQAQLGWSNVLLMCSEAEAFGRVTVEALKSGRPVIGSRHGTTAELLVDGCTGILFEPGDAGGLAAAMRRCGRDPALVESMSANARSRMAGHYMLQGEVDTFVDAFSSVVAARGNSSGLRTG